MDFYWVDCGCGGHESWGEFTNLEKAKKYYNSLKCREKILYTAKDGKFKTLEEMKSTFQEDGAPENDSDR